MSYLLTEVAMEMLGWRFYDEDGVPRPINFEGTNNIVCEGTENLAITLATQFPNLRFTLPAKSVVQAKADSSSSQIPPFQSAVVIDLDADSPVSDNNGNEILTTPNSLADEMEMAVNSNISNSPLKPFDLRIETVRGGYDVSCEKNTRTKISIDEPTPQLSIVRVTSAGDDVETNSVVMSANQTETESMEEDVHDSHQSNATAITAPDCQKDVDDFIDLTDDDRNTTHIGIEQNLEMEINKISTDLKRQKDILYEITPESHKHSSSTYQDVLKAFREQENKNLQSELRNMQLLNQEAERISSAHFENAYPKYINITEKLSKLKPSKAKTTDVENMPSTSGIMKRKQVARKKTSPIK